MHSFRIALTAAGLLLATPTLAHAGMPRARLGDMAKLRLESISFFLVGFLICALFIQVLWNWLRKDFTALPRLSYPKAVGLVALWGLLFVLVLTMISGARELMTPGAWEKTGLTYRVGKDAPPLPAQPSDEEHRRASLDRLRVELWRYAKDHEGRFPPSSTGPEINADHWQMPGPTGLRYLYSSGHYVNQGNLPLAFEPEINGPQRWVLLTNGQIRSMEWSELEPLLTGGQRN